MKLYDKTKEDHCHWPAERGRSYQPLPLQLLQITASDYERYMALCKQNFQPVIIPNAGYREQKSRQSGRSGRRSLASRGNASIQSITPSAMDRPGRSRQSGLSASERMSVQPSVRIKINLFKYKHCKLA